MKKQLLLASSALALVLTGTAFAGGGEHMAAPAPAPAPAPAAKSGGFYVGLNGGYIITAGKVKFKDFKGGDSAAQKPEDRNFKDDAKSGFGFGGSVGYRFGEMPVRVELGFNYNILTLTDDAKNNRNIDSLNGYSIMGRAFYDFDMGQFVPYVGLGVGYDSVTSKPKGDGDDIDFTGLGYEGIIGVDYKINDNFSVGGSFTYHGTTAESKSSTVDTAGSTAKASLASGQWMTIGLGLKYFF